MTSKRRAMWKADGTLSYLGKPSWLTDENLQTLMTAVEDAGREIYAVGGCIRDTVIDRERAFRVIENDPMNDVEDGSFLTSDMDAYFSTVNDVDLATSAHPDDIIQIIKNLPPFRKTLWKAIPTGIEHGTVTAVPPHGTPYEITTYRTDVKTDGRRAEVAFSKDIKDDAMRRDFTINAFYADRHGNVQDVVGGSADLKARRIRFIGDPTSRIQEDYLRILRFFRFHASHAKPNDGIDQEGLAACALLADGLEGISRERIGAEMTRLIMNWDVGPIVGSMEQSGVLNRILPGASVLTLARLLDLEESYPIEGRMIPPKDLGTRLASLGCEDIGDRLRLSKADQTKIALVLAQAGSTTPPHELAYRHDYWPAVHCMLLRWASLQMPFDESVLPDLELGAKAIFPIAAADLIPAFTGKALGDRLKGLEEVWIASKFTMTKRDLLALQ